MKVIGGTDAHVMYLLPVATLAKLLAMPIETLEFSEEARVWEITIEDPHGVTRIKGSLQPIASGFDSCEMSGGDEASDSYESKIFHTG
jgi:hypothetical protein